MRIVLPTRFNNPRLPRLPGFSDSFDRPAANTLGSTDNGLPWQIIDYPGTSSVWGTTGNGTAGMKSSPSSTHAAVVNAGAANGVLSARLASFDPDLTGNRFGLALRTQDMDNCILLQTTLPNAPGWRLSRYVNGTAVGLSQSATPIAPGDEIEVILDGASITVFSNGAQILADEVSELATVTTHGMFAFSTSDAEWDSIEFTP